MKDYRRAWPLFSLCGLNCGLCPMHQRENGCPGCGGGDGHQSCPVIRCSREHDAGDYCFLCAEFPCGRYAEPAEETSFSPYRNRRRDLETVRTGGTEAYRLQLEEKMALLRQLLERYNDGRRKSLFCTAVNLLALEDIRQVLRELEAGVRPEQPLRERAETAARRLTEMAAQRGVELRRCRSRTD